MCTVHDYHPVSIIIRFPSSPLFFSSDFLSCYDFWVFLSMNIGTCIFKRRELATSFETRSRFPELVIQEEKRVRFVVVNGLSIIEKPTNMHIEDAEW